jgi:molybdopterin synthase catalytic subunit
MFRFSAESLNVNGLRQSLVNPKSGAVVAFEGLVRNHNDGREVLALSYEGHESLALKEAAKIIDEAKRCFEIYDVVCVHRLGDLAVGDLAVWVGVSAAHRGAAFGACQYVIDEVKARVPIWKKETYTDGSSGWVNCQNCGTHGAPVAAGKARSAEHS